MSPAKASARARWLARQLADLWPTVPGEVRREIVKSLRNTSSYVCQHHRHWSWYAEDCTAPGGRRLCVACCDCGKVLTGGVSDAELVGGTS